MTFAFRWLLVLFKREFEVDDICLLWDVLFSSPYTPQFEIFVTVGLLKAVSPQIVEQSLTYDELLKFTNSMSLRMPVVDCIVIAHELYDFVASQMAWQARKAGENAFRPKLADVLLALKETDAPAASSVKAGSQRK